MSVRKDLADYGQAGRGAIDRGPAASRPDKVGFIIAGTQKGGTTALASYLYEHPEICIGGAKEVHFFDTDALFRAGGVPDYSAYHARFDPAGRERILGDATPIYMYWEPALQRIWQYNPAMKLIVILRNPVARAFSHWNMQRTKNLDPLPFFEALKTEKERCRAALPSQHPLWSYADRGFYCGQLRRIWRYFPAEQTLILKSEELRTAPDRLLASIAAFLGIESFGPVERREVYARDYDEPMTDEARNYLRDIFEYEIRSLERMLGWDCSDWVA
jgi:hypothetical protein